MSNRECIGAYTAATGKGYPPFVSINRLENGDVEVSVRSAPTIRQGIYVCCHEKRPGNCQPGSENCNNYCNMAPEKGPMQDHPMPCEHVDVGAQASCVIPAEEWDRIRNGA